MDGGDPGQAGRQTRLGVWGSRSSRALPPGWPGCCTPCTTLLTARQLEASRGAGGLKGGSAGKARHLERFEGAEGWRSGSGPPSAVLEGSWHFWEGTRVTSLQGKCQRPAVALCLRQLPSSSEGASLSPTAGQPVGHHPALPLCQVQSGKCLVPHSHLLGPQC